MDGVYPIPHGNPWLGDKGVWRGGVSDGVSTATVSCPDCGEVCSLTSHNIDAQGRVTPSLVCPTRNCDFHKFVELVGWDK